MNQYVIFTFEKGVCAQTPVGNNYVRKTSTILIKENIVSLILQKLIYQ